MRQQNSKEKLELKKETFSSSVKETLRLPTKEATREMPEGILTAEDEITSHRAENSISIIVGLNIKRLRVCKGWSQEELSGKSGISREIISNIENGKGNLLSNIGRLIDSLGYSYFEYIRTDTICWSREGEYIIDHEKLNDSYWIKRCSYYLDLLLGVMLELTKPIEK